MSLEAQVRNSDDLILAVGEFPAGPPDPSVRIQEIDPEAWAAVAQEPGHKYLQGDGTITVQAPPPPPLVTATAFETQEDAERLALVNERAATDPAFAALADLTLGTKGVQT